MSEHEVRCVVNGALEARSVDSRRTLADFLREDLELTGTKLGCEHGVCGACTVLVDGSAMRACLMLAVQADGATITTVEGLAEGDELHPIQASFRKHHALQCGFCTPGFLMTTYALLQETDKLTEDTVRDALSGNICRCTGYQHIIDAVVALGAGEVGKSEETTTS
ncbi:MAG TPA: (2Fe-2S)-binding protein [Polyangiales bacterium]|nr:(2Fe-2S)-binding protein [Polyangiales bacterium]